MEFNSNDEMKSKKMEATLYQLLEELIPSVAENDNKNPHDVIEGLERQGIVNWREFINMDTEILRTLTKSRHWNWMIGHIRKMVWMNIEYNEPGAAFAYTYTSEMFDVYITQYKLWNSALDEKSIDRIRLAEANQRALAEAQQQTEDNAKTDRIRLAKAKRRSQALAIKQRDFEMIKQRQVEAQKIKQFQNRNYEESENSFEIARTRLACTHPDDADKLLFHTQASKQARTEYRILNFNSNLISCDEFFHILKTFESAMPHKDELPPAEPPPAEPPPEPPPAPTVQLEEFFEIVQAISQLRIKNVFLLEHTTFYSK